jgi:ferrous-iron efflux pump FieF
MMTPTTETPASNNESHTHLGTSVVTMGAVVVLVFAKTIGYVFSDSAAVLSSLIDSLTDVGLSLMTFFALRFSAKPADTNHRYGHGKIEGVSALLQAGFLFGGATFLVFEAFDRLINPVPMHGHIFAMTMLALSGIVSFGISFLQKRALKKEDSLALEADHAHYSTDVWINAVAFVVVWVTYMGWAPVWVDTLAALGIAGLLGYASYTISHKAFGMLTDRELPHEIRNRIIEIVVRTEGALGLHDLRTYQSGRVMFVSFDMEVDPNIMLWSAHEIARAVEMNLIAEFPNAEILIHLDPAGDTDDTRHSSQKDPHA